MELNIEEKSVSDMVAQGIALGGTASQPAEMRIDRRMALAAFGSMAATIAVMLVITVWGYMS